MPPPTSPPPPPPRSVNYCKMTKQRVHYTASPVNMTTGCQDKCNMYVNSSHSLSSQTIFRDACNICSKKHHRLNESSLLLPRNVFMSHSQSFVKCYLQQRHALLCALVIALTASGSLLLPSIPLAHAAPSSSSSSFSVSNANQSDIARVEGFIDHKIYRRSTVDDDECGRQIIRSGRIVGGEDAYQGEFPWTVSIRLNNQHYCGGVLLNRRWILTAAHCVAGYSARSFWARLGALSSNRRSNSYSSSNEEDIQISHTVVHQEYSRPRPFANDIALLRLSQDIGYTEYIRPICLPETADTADGDFYTGAKGLVVGWGWIKDRKGTGEQIDTGVPADILQKVHLPVIKNGICSSWYQSQGKHVVISPKQFCAGYKEGGRDACRGDSGGPMLLRDPNTSRYTVVGIVSAGIGCALRDLPGLYTRVNAYIPWIEKYIDS